MSSHQLAIAKASFSAGLLRPDPISISRDEIAHFHTLLDFVTTECSPTNIQKCKHWILHNVTQSTARVTGLGKYLTALSTSFTEPGKFSTAKLAGRQPSAKRKRLYLLYLINDLLHHAKVHSIDASLSSKIQPSLVGLVSSAASFRNISKHQRKLHSLLDIWEDKQYYSAEYIDKLREAVRLALEVGEATDVSGHTNCKDEVDTVIKSSRSIPFMMPAMHGDQGMPWYDLPAANLIPHIIPNSARPINPELVKPLRFIAGPANETLANALREFLREVNNNFGTIQSHDHDHDLSWDLDELGQPIPRDEMTGEILSADGYYGWSKAFCEKMKRRRRGLDYPESSSYREGDRRGRSMSRTRSQSRTSSGSSKAHKRRRYSGSDGDRSRARSRSISRRGRRTWSSSRSASGERGVNAQQDKSGETTQRSLSRARVSRSARDRSHSSHARSLSPTRKSILPSRGDFPEQSRASTIYAQDSHNSSQSQHTFLPGNDYVFNASIIPIPPPPPPHYQGTWPPPPPPSMVRYGQQGGPWPPLAPPFLHGAQQWPSTPYGQPQAGGNSWPQISPHVSSSGGAYGAQDRGGSTVPQQQYSDGATGYNGYGGTAKGKGWSK